MDNFPFVASSSVPTRNGAPTSFSNKMFVVAIRRCETARDAGKFCAVTEFTSTVFGLRFVIPTQCVHRGSLPVDHAACSDQFPPVDLIQMLVAGSGGRALEPEIKINKQKNSQPKWFPFAIPFPLSFSDLPDRRIPGNCRKELRVLRELTGRERLAFPIAKTFRADMVSGQGKGHYERAEYRRVV